MTKNSKRLIATLGACAFLLVGGAVLISLPTLTETSYAANTHVDVVFDKVYGLSNTNYIGAQYSGKIYLGGASDSMLGNNVTFDYPNTTAVGSALSSGNMDAQSLFYHRYLKVQSITNPYSQGGSTLDLSASYYDLHDSDSQTSISGQPLMNMIDVLNRGHVSWYLNTATYTFTIYYTVSYALDLDGATLKANDGTVPDAVYTAMKNSIKDGVMIGALKYDTYHQKWTICGSEDVNTALALFEKTGYNIWEVENEANESIIEIHTDPKIYSREAVVCEKLHLQSSPISYSVELDPNGGELSGSQGVQVKYDDYYPEFPQLTRAGYDFDGWWTQKVGGQQIDSTMKCTTAQSQTLYAHWIPHTYNITFDPGDGECSVSSTVVTCGQPYGKGTGLNGSLPVATKEGYAFTGWWTTPSGSGDKISSGTIVGPIEAEQTLYARYEAGAENVYLNVNGGTFAEDVSDIKIVKYDSAYGELPYPTRDDWQVFVGWYTEPEAGEKVTSETIVSNPQSHTLYARWADSWFNHMSQSLSQDESGNYLISSAEDLALLVYQSITQLPTEPITCIQTCDIDLKQYYWPDITPLTEGAQFYGTYNGKNHAIRNMHSSEHEATLALFYSVKGSVINLSNLNVDLHGDSVAGIAINLEFDYKMISSNNNVEEWRSIGQIAYCTVSGNIVATNIAGGIVAKVDGVVYHDHLEIILLCTNNINIQSANCEYVGGIVGYVKIGSFYYTIDKVDSSLNCVSMCTNNGTIIGGTYVGGIAGFCELDHLDDGSGKKYYPLSIINCINTATLGGGTYVGGIVGNLSYGAINSCYNYGNFEDISAISYGGGIVGYFFGSCSGSSLFTVINNCVFDGKVTMNGSYYFGGIVGHVFNEKRTTSTSGHVSFYANNCYVKIWLNDLSKSDNCSAVVGYVLGQDSQHSGYIYNTSIIANADIKNFENVSISSTSYVLSFHDDTASLVYLDGEASAYDGVFAYDENNKLFEGLPVPTVITAVGKLMTQTNIIDYLTSYVTSLGGTVSAV